MKKILALVLALTMVFSFVASAAFSDVDSSTPAGKAIDVLADKGIVGGKGDGKFDPTGDVKREEFSKIVYIAKTGETAAPAGKDIFTDVTAASWAYGYITWAYENKIVGGKGDGIFEPGGKIKVAEAAKMLVVALGGDSALAYPDGFMAEAEKDGFFADMAAMDKFKDLNRAETAQMVYNAFFNEGDTEPGPGPVEPVGYNEEAYGPMIIAVNSISATSIKVSRMDLKSTALKIDANEMLSTTTITTKLVNEKEYPLTANCKIEKAKGRFGNNEKLSGGTIADILPSNAEGFYTAELTFQDGAVSAIKFFSTQVPYEWKQLSNGYFPKPTSKKIYLSPGMTSLVQLGTEVEATGIVAGELQYPTAPSAGATRIAYRTDGSLIRYGVEFIQPLTAKAGDKYAFAWSAQTTDLTKIATAVCTIEIIKGTTVKDYVLEVNKGESINPDSTFWYDNVSYAPGAPAKTPSFLIYDMKKGTTVTSGTTYTTDFGGTVVRNLSDNITYTAPDKTGTDIFFLSFHDGTAPTLAKVTVNIK